MRLCYVVDGWPNLSETFVQREVVEAGRAHDVRVLSLADAVGASQEPDVEAFRPRVHVLPAVGGGGLTGLAVRRPLRAARGLGAALAARREGMGRRAGALAREARALSAWGVERIHAHFARRATAAAHVLSRYTGTPFGFTAHAYDVFSQPVRLAQKAAVASWVVTCSAAARDEVGRRCGPATAERVRVIRHGLDLARWRREGGERAPGPLRVLAVGRLVRKKGFDVLLRALATLGADAAFEARVVGAGPEDAALRAIADAASLRGRVHFPGAATPEGVRAVMREWADVLVAPSRVEADGDRDGVPNVVVEAMACALPIVATGVGGLPEAVRDGETGAVVAPEDPEALAGALRALAADPAARARLGSGGRALAEREFDLARNVADLLAWIERAGDRPRG